MQETNLDALENSVSYDGGYQPDSPVIKWFWKTVHAMSDEEKKNLLRFVTGSHRVPTGGLSQLNFVIARHGEDSDRYSRTFFASVPSVWRNTTSETKHSALQVGAMWRNKLVRLRVVNGSYKQRWSRCCKIYGKSRFSLLPRAVKSNQN